MLRLRHFGLLRRMEGRLFSIQTATRTGLNASRSGSMSEMAMLRQLRSVLPSEHPEDAVRKGGQH